MHGTFRQSPEEEAVDRAERKLAAQSLRPCACNIVQYPGELGCREIGVDQQTRAGPDKLSRACLSQALAKGRRAAVLPDDGIVNRFACCTVPNERGLALIRDANRGNLAACLGHCFARGL